VVLIAVGVFLLVHRFMYFLGVRFRCFLYLLCIEIGLLCTEIGFFFKFIEYEFFRS
jgi:hypothetical protein